MNKTSQLPPRPVASGFGQLPLDANRPAILVTNDDGYEAGGLVALVKALRGLGRVIVCAPDSPRSGYSASYTSSRPINLSLVSDDGEDTSNSQRMAYVGIPIKASVAAVRIFRKVESPFEQFRLVAVARMLVVFKQTFKLLLYHHLLFGSDRFGSRQRLGFLFCLFSCVYDVHGYILINSNLGKAQLLSRVDAIGLQLVELFDFCRRGVMFAGDGSQGFAFAHGVDATTVALLFLAIGIFALSMAGIFAREDLWSLTVVTIVAQTMRKEPLLVAIEVLVV